MRRSNSNWHSSIVLRGIGILTHSWRRTGTRFQCVKLCDEKYSLPPLSLPDLFSHLFIIKGAKAIMAYNHQNIANALVRVFPSLELDKSRFRNKLKSMQLTSHFLPSWCLPSLSLIFIKILLQRIFGTLQQIEEPSLSSTRRTTTSLRSPPVTGTK